MHSVLFLIVVPLLGAFTSLFTKGFNQIVSLAITVFAGLFSLLIYTYGFLPVSVEIGGWPVPFGINFVVTSLSVGFILLINLAALIALLLVREKKNEQFYSTYLVLLASANGIVLTGDIFNFYIFSELVTFSITALIAYPRDRKSTGAALKYLILASTASSFLLIGIGLLYKTLGTLNMADIATKIDLLNPQALAFIVILMLIGIFVELELFPFNMWVPKAYLGGTTSVNVMLHGMLGTAGTYIILRILLTMFSDGSGLLVDKTITHSILLIAMLTILVSEIAAFNENKLKKVLAFSSMGQMGLITFGFMVGNRQAIVGAFYLVIANFTAKIVLFALAGEFIAMSGSPRWEGMRGIGRKHPMAGISFVIGSLSLMGVPFFAGFWGKLGLIQGAIDGSGILVAGIVIILITAIIEGIYFMKIAHTLFLEQRDDYRTTARKKVLFIAALLSMFVVAIGVQPGLIEHNIAMAADEIMNSHDLYLNVVLSGR